MPLSTLCRGRHKHRLCRPPGYADLERDPRSSKADGVGIIQTDPPILSLVSVQVSFSAEAVRWTNLLTLNRRPTDSPAGYSGSAGLTCPRRSTRLLSWVEGQLASQMIGVHDIRT